MNGPSPAVLAVLRARRGGLAGSEVEIAWRARSLAGEAGAGLRLLVVGGEERWLADLPDAEEVLLARAPAEGEDLGGVAALAGRLLESSRFCLLASTEGGNEIAARAAARTGAALAPGARSVTVRPGGGLRVERAVYGGRATATVEFEPGVPVALTLARGLERPARGGARAREAATVAVEPSPAPFRLVRRWLPGPWEMELGEAEVVVAGGRGVATREGFALLAELAGLLGGALAASRPVVDAGLVDRSRQVGLSGRTVAPRLYVACGISGSPHHIVGMRESGTVIAINRDPAAPIFGLADVRLVGDAEEILPSLIAAVRERVGGGRAKATRSVEASP